MAEGAKPQSAVLPSLRSIRARLSAALTLVIAVLLIVADVGLAAYMRQSAFRSADRSLDEAMDTVQEALRNETIEVEQFHNGRRAEQL